MCGIAGLFDLKGRRDPDRALIERMNDIQFHRGPDEAGLHLEPGVALAHRRLSIIDLASGQQPLFNADRSVVVVFNGEIYNYQELMAELQALGYQFRTRSDTEVIVHGWAAWGEACVERFRGMFAFALWDRNRETVFMARDRLGVKPMFYAELADGWLAFGSELKTLTQCAGLDRRLDPHAVEEYFALGYVADPRSIYCGAKKLPAAHTLCWRRGESLPQPKRYWDLHFQSNHSIGLTEAMEELDARLAESIRLRMIAEVPLGAFLSGGVDSSVVVAHMARQSSAPVNTCSIAFDDPAFNESAFAQQVADRYKTNHFVETVTSDDYDLIDTLAALYDEPYADSSAIPTYRVCQLARKHVTVALSGDGGDEFFGGYRRYRLHMMEERARGMLPLWLRRPMFGAMARLYPKADWAPRMFRAKTTFQGIARDSVSAYFHSMSVLRDDERSALYSDKLRAQLGGYHAQEAFNVHAARAQTDDPLALIQYIDINTWLVGDINTKVDRASMAHALEVREPLMDHKLVEWAATLPQSLRIKGQEGKYLLKRAAEPLLPHDILYRPKMGFSVPLARWFRGPLKERVRSALTGERLLDTGFFDHKNLRSMLEAHESGLRDFSAPIWSLVMFDAFLGLQ
ncbi:MAG: amidotransferase 1, exosortase A system-associated [Rhodocyclaceae bacterium]